MARRKKYESEEEKKASQTKYSTFYFNVKKDSVIYAWLKNQPSVNGALTKAVEFYLANQ